MVTLKLRTTGDFTPITIDDKEYRLKSQLDLSLSVQHELMRLNERISQLSDLKKKRNGDFWEKEYAALDSAMVDGISKLFIDPTGELIEKIGKLGLENRTKIFEVVFPKKEEEKKTGTKDSKSSRASKGSTAVQ